MIGMNFQQISTRGLNKLAGMVIKKEQREDTNANYINGPPASGTPATRRATPIKKTIDHEALTVVSNLH